MTESLVGGASAAPLSMRATAVVASAVIRAARQLFTDLEHGRRIDAVLLRSAMEAAFGASDATSAWNWKTAYDACEAATVLFLRRYGTAMRAKAAPELTPDAAFAALTEGRTVLDLAEGLQLRRIRVMGAYRIELSGFADTMRDRLRTYELFAEIISWKLRMFVPTDGSGAEVLAKLLDRYAIERIAKREAA